MCDNKIRINDLDLVVVNDVTCLELACLALRYADAYCLGGIAVELNADILDVKDDLCHVLDDSGNSCELVVDIIDLDRRYSSTGKRRKQNSAQGVTQRCAVSTLER